jgi:hypothetical protein
VALRKTTISVSDPPSTWWPRGSVKMRKAHSLRAR